MTATGVSVIIPCYQAHGTLVRALDGLLAQDGVRWEALIISDDGEDYAAVLAAHGFSDDRLRFFSTGHVAAGESVGRNIGLRHARYDLVAPLDADDRFAPGRLARLAPLAYEHGAAADNVVVIRDEDGVVLSTLYPPEEGVVALTAERFLATSVPVVPVIRRDVCPAWTEGMMFAADVVFNVQLLDRLRQLPMVMQPMYEYYQREGALTVRSDAAARAEHFYVHMLTRLADDGLGIADADLRARFADAIQAKRARNAAFERARLAGRCATFQEFLALGAD